MKRITAIVIGRVQGVSYRYYTQREANRLGLTGWVRNEPDGSVRIVAEGPEDSLKGLVMFLELGPPAARVEQVLVDWSMALTEFRSFEIRF